MEAASVLMVLWTVMGVLKTHAGARVFIGVLSNGWTSETRDVGCGTWDVGCVLGTSS